VGRKIDEIFAAPIPADALAGLGGRPW